MCPYLQIHFDYYLYCLTKYLNIPHFVIISIVINSFLLSIRAQLFNFYLEMKKNLLICHFFLLNSMHLSIFHLIEFHCFILIIQYLVNSYYFDQFAFIKYFILFMQNDANLHIWFYLQFAFAVIITKLCLIIHLMVYFIIHYHLIIMKKNLFIANID